MRILDQISALVAVADGGEGVGGPGSMGSWGSGDETKRLNVYARLDFLNSRKQLSCAFN